MNFRRFYEINTRVWLWELVAQGVIAHPNLAEIPERYIQAWQRWQIDAVWLMGVWEPSPYSARVARGDPRIVAACQHALADFTPDDCISSPYAVRRYDVSTLLGGIQGLLGFRQRLREAGIGLILDFVPNHTACDHPWVQEHPEYYVQGSATDHTDTPEAYFQANTVHGMAYIAHGRDPYFPPWTDTAQLNYANPEVHAAMQAELLRIAQWCDGVRCDMAMLCLSDVFTRTWSQRKLTPPREFWPAAIQAVHRQVPDFCFIAEVYWQLEPQLQQLGFTLTYDKGFYDALVARDTARLHGLIQAGRASLDACLRFLENHDEARAAAYFSVAQQEAAALTILTLPGAVLLHDGQIEGRTSHIPVQLRRRPLEPAHARLQAFYDRVLTLPKLHDGVFYLLQPRMAWDQNFSYRGMLAWAWCNGQQRWMLVTNYSDIVAQCFVSLANPSLPAGRLRFRDRLHDVDYDRESDEVQHRGLYIELSPFESHLFEITPEHGETAP
jgi:hypothetical protein